MKWRAYEKLVLILLLAVTLLSFQSLNQIEWPEDNEKVKKLTPLGRQVLEKRILELKEKKIQECKIKAIIAAESYVDSLIIREAAASRLGIEGIPFKPIRPGAPEIILQADSLNIGPLFDDDSEN